MERLFGYDAGMNYAKIQNVRRHLSIQKFTGLRETTFEVNKKKLYQ